MHVKYFDKYVPSYFHDGMSNNNSLHENKYEITSILLLELKQAASQLAFSLPPHCLLI